MPRLTRHELKQDEFRTTVEQIEQYGKEHLREIVTAGVLLLVVGGLTGGLKSYLDRQKDEDNQQLSVALRTFRAYVGPAQSDAQTQGLETFATSQEKYKKALEEFSKITQATGLRKFLPKPKAAAIARYHIGVCQAELGDHAAAIKTLEEASHASDSSIASLAKLALGNELAGTGKVQGAIKIYQALAIHPTVTVPKATALLAEAAAYRATQPAQARLIYEQIRREYGSNAMMAEILKQEMASLPK